MAPPVNKLLQLLRQKPPEPPDQSPVAQAVSHPKRRSTPAPKSSIQDATKNGTQTATHGPQYATSGGIGVPSDGIQYATQGRTLDATNSIQSATDGSILYAPVSSIQYATGNDISLATSISKGAACLQFLIANRDSSDPSQTVVIGYHAISTYWLSRNGSRKVIEELCKKGLIKRIATQRGGMQGSIYILESSIQYATNSSILYPAGGD